MGNNIDRIASAIENHKDSNVKKISRGLSGGVPVVAILLNPHISCDEQFDLRYIAPGKSGAWVLLAMIAGKKPRVIKFGTKSVIEKEKNNYENKVRDSMPSDIIPDLRGDIECFGEYASIAYHWVGNYDNVLSFRDYFLKESSCDKLIDIIDNLIQELFQWYQPKTGNSLPSDQWKWYSDDITEKIEVKINEWDKGDEAKEKLLNVLNDQDLWRDKLPTTIECSNGVCHGDLNCSNIIIVQKEKSLSSKIIDFASVSDKMTPARDWAKMERDIKLRCLRDSNSDPTKYREFLEKIDTICNNPESLNAENNNLHIEKYYRSISFIRNKYCKNVEHCSDMPYLEYLIYLFCHTLAFVTRDEIKEDSQLQYAVLDSVLRTKDLIDRIISDGKIGIVCQGVKGVSAKNGKAEYDDLKDTPSVVMEVPTVPTVSTLNIAIENYRKKAESLHGVLPVAGFITQLKVPIDIKDIYIPLRAIVDLRGVHEKGKFADAAHAEKILHECDNSLEISLLEAFRQTGQRNQQGIVILGDPGSGKTTHLKRLLLHCLREGPEELHLDANMLPVFLPLRELDDLDKGIDSFIQKQFSSPHLDTPHDFGKELLERGNLLLLFDGLDEVADLKLREKVARWIVDAVACHSTCRFVVTCRFAGYSETVRLSAKFLEMHIRPFNSEQAEAFIRKWYNIVERGLAKDPDQAAGLASEKADNILARLKESDFRAQRVFELTHNPLLLANICLVHRHRGTLPAKRGKLYEECIGILLENWRGAKGITVSVSAQDGCRALQPAAYWLHSEDGRTRATAKELAPHIEPVLKSIKWKKGSASDFLSTIRDESGLLTGWDQDNYGFMHLGFQEYLVAREIRNLAFNNKRVLADIASRFGESWWQEVGLLMLSLEDPLFEPYMREVVKLPAFVNFPNLVDASIEDASEISVKPFIELLEMKPGNEKELWQRQFAALRVLTRLDSEKVDSMKSILLQHPFPEINKWVKDRFILEPSVAIDTKTAEQGGYKLKKIFGGKFIMGSPKSEKGRDDDEGPLHEVSVTDFYIGIYPVTNREYELFLADTPDKKEPEYWGDRRFNRPEQPVVGVSWDDANEYAKWAGLRLPTEAEWEYSCRAKTNTRFYTGNKDTDLDQAGWYCDNSQNQTHPVGEKEPNNFGLYDMHGNVREWCMDWFSENYYDVSKKQGIVENPTGPESGSYRVLRGGSWDYNEQSCRSAYRRYSHPESRSRRIGFRLVFVP